MDTYAVQYLGKTVTVKMDRPMGTRHPRISEIYYIWNYG
jgi:inorganic pyrophosphatase